MVVYTFTGTSQHLKTINHMVCNYLDFILGAKRYYLQLSEDSINISDTSVWNMWGRRNSGTTSTYLSLNMAQVLGILLIIKLGSLVQ